MYWLQPSPPAVGEELKQTGADGNRIRAHHFFGNSSSVQPEEKQERQSLSGEDGPVLA